MEEDLLSQRGHIFDKTDNSLMGKIEISAKRSGNWQIQEKMIVMNRDSLVW
jgi:hypothetical protein